MILGVSPASNSSLLFNYSNIEPQGAHTSPVILAARLKKVSQLAITHMIIVGSPQAMSIEKIRIMVANSGGAVYSLGVKMAEIIMKNIPGVQASVLPGGGFANIIEIGIRYAASNVNG